MLQLILIFTLNQKPFSKDGATKLQQKPAEKPPKETPRPQNQKPATFDLTKPDRQHQNAQPFAYRTAANVSKGTGSISKVVGPEGGRLNYLGCRLFFCFYY